MTQQLNFGCAPTGPGSELFLYSGFRAEEGMLAYARLDEPRPKKSFRFVSDRVLVNFVTDLRLGKGLASEVERPCDCGRVVPPR